MRIRIYVLDEDLFEDPDEDIGEDLDETLSISLGSISLGIEMKVCMRFGMEMRFRFCIRIRSLV